MGPWSRIFAAVYDRGMREVEEAGLADRRGALLAGAAGRVLEIGAGTGANLPFYPAAVTELVLAEPEEPMARRLEAKLRGRPAAARVLRARAERLPVESGSFDFVVSTLVLCTVADPAAALAEARRVLAPGGTLLLVEHVRSDDPALARWQDRLRGPWSWLACGCEPNRRTLELVRDAGFDVAGLRPERLRKMPRLVAPLVVGAAPRG